MVQEGAQDGGGRIERHTMVEGSERAELRTGEGEIERDVGGVDREEGGRAGIYGRREKQRGSARRTLPHRAGAKPGGSDRTTEITNLSFD
jgi:hypothetical protein